MLTIHLQIILIAILVSIACTLPGVFLVLRGVALMSDAISHAILPGIAIMFLFTQRLDSPLLIIGASLAGLLTVFFTEVLIHTQRLKKDAAIGLVFPLFFSIGVIIISQYARNVHLDIDMVLLGELAFAPFNRLLVCGFDVGPQALWIMSAIVGINGLCVYLFYKELTIATFDNTLAYIFGFTPMLLHYGLMTITSITAVGAFDIVGSIVVVALIITPPATAYLLTQRLSSMIFVSIVISCIAAILGCLCALYFDISIAGAIATMTGLLFLGALLFSPRTGIIVHYYHHKQRNIMLAQDLLCVYLNSEKKEIKTIAQELGWDIQFVNAVVEHAKKRGLLETTDSYIYLSSLGKTRMQEINIRFSTMQI